MCVCLQQWCQRCSPAHRFLWQAFPVFPKTVSVCSVTLFLMMGLTTLCGVEVSHWSVVPAPSRVALQPEGSMAAGALPVLWHVAVWDGTLHSLASTSAISRLSSFKTRGWTPSGPNDLMKFNLSAWSETFSVFISNSSHSSDQSAAKKVSGLKCSPSSVAVKNNAKKLQHLSILFLLSSHAPFRPLPSVNCSSSLAWLWILMYLKEYSSLGRVKHCSSFFLVLSISSLHLTCHVLWPFLFSLFNQLLIS